MGMFSVNVRIYARDEARFENLDLIVDTGSLFTWVPKDVAERLGLRPERAQKFQAIDRDGIERPVGDALIELEGERGYVGIVFGEQDDARVLGVTALERLGLEVNPATQTLRRMDALPAFATSYVRRGSVISP